VNAALRRLLRALKPYTDMTPIRAAYRFALPYMKAHRGCYAGLLLVLGADILLTLLYARYFGRLADTAIRGDWELLLPFAAAGAGIVLLRLAATYFEETLETGAVTGVTRDVKTALYRHFLLLPAEHASRLRSGRLLSHMTNDADCLEGMIGRNAIDLIRIPLLYAAVFAYLSQISASMSALTLLLAPAAAAAGAAVGLVLRRNNRRILETIGSISQQLDETLRGLRVIRAYTLETRFFRQFAERSQELHELQRTNARLRGLFYAGGGAVSSFAFLLSLCLGAYYVAEGRMTVGALLTYVSLVNYLVDPLTGLAGLWAGIQRSVAAVERLAGVMSLPAAAELPDTLEAARPVGTLELDGITFGYEGGRSAVRGISLRVEAGMTVAIVGPSGAGKTTLFRLLQGLYTPRSGTILLDGVPIEALPPSELRSLIACVPQEPFLFAGSVRDNLLLARPGIGEEEMVQAARTAQAHDFVLSLPEGYDTDLGENGAQLSGGQQQRLCIARALLRNAPILLLDEATSALDGVTELRLKEALDRTAGKRITLVIAHRLSTVRSADLIVVMREGRIAEMGMHGELLRAGGLYAELVQSQGAGDRAEERGAEPAAAGSLT